MSRARLIALLLALATLLVYLPAARHDSINYDDGLYVFENQPVAAGLTRAGFVWAFTSFHGGNWHPVTWLSHMLDCQLFDLDPGPPHLVNILFHAANSALLFLLLWRLTKALRPAAAVAALFAWHPLHVESVAWIAERKDVLSTFFALLTLHAYVRYANSQGPETRAQGHPSVCFGSALIFFALGLMSKPMLVTLPFVLLLLDFWPLQRLKLPRSTASPRVAAKIPAANWQGLLLEKWPFFLLTLVSCVITVLAQSRGEALRSLAHVPLGYRLENAPVALVLYLGKLFWPVDLAVIYPMPATIPLFRTAGALALLAVITAWVWRERNRMPFLLTGWLWFVGTLVPVIGLVKVGDAALADRYSYVPSIGLFILVAFGLERLVDRFPAPPIALALAAVLIFGACLWQTERQLGYWRDSETLFRQALAVTRNNVDAHINYGLALEQRGQLETALAEYREAVRIAPANVEGHNNLGHLLAGLGRPEEALAEYQIALNLKPDQPGLHLSLGSVLADLGRFGEATNEFAAAARLDPESPKSHFQTAKVLFKLGNDDGAIAELQAARELEPDNFQILAYTAHVLAANANTSARDAATALALATRANALTGGSQPFVLDALGMAYAENGKFDEASNAVQQALELAAAGGVKNLASFRERLARYEQRQPWRESFLATNQPAP